jgi:predicted acyltransferase
MIYVERLSTLRIPGVLQRISIVFFCCSILYFRFGWLGQLRITALLLFAYYILMNSWSISSIKLLKEQAISTQSVESRSQVFLASRQGRVTRNEKFKKRDLERSARSEYSIL